MPIYQYRCLESDCAEITEVFRRVDEYLNCPSCERCGSKTRKIISRHFVHGDFDPYYDDNLETFITSKQHRKVVMKAQGVEESFGQNWHTSAKKHRKVG